MNTLKLVSLIFVGQVYGNYKVEAPTQNGYPVAPHPAPTLQPVYQPNPPHYPSPIHPNNNHKCHKVTKVFDVCDNDYPTAIHYPIYDDRYRNTRYRDGLPTVYITLPCVAPTPTAHPIHYKPIKPTSTPCTTALPTSHHVYHVSTTTPCTTSTTKAIIAVTTAVHVTTPCTTTTTKAIIAVTTAIPATTPCTTATKTVTAVTYKVATTTPCTTSRGIIAVTTAAYPTATHAVIPTSYKVPVSTPCTTTTSQIHYKENQPSHTRHVEQYKVYPTTTTSTPCTTTTTNAYLINYSTQAPVHIYPTQSSRYAEAAAPTRAY